jgi:hypothetical protein
MMYFVRLLNALLSVCPLHRLGEETEDLSLRVLQLQTEKSRGVRFGLTSPGRTMKDTGMEVRVAKGMMEREISKERRWMQNWRWLGGKWQEDSSKDSRKCPSDSAYCER